MDQNWFEWLKRKVRNHDLQMAEITQFATVAAVANTYTLDLSQKKNFAITTADAAAKTIAFSNIPQTENTLLTVNMALNYTSAAAITYPTGTVWKDGVIPSFTASKKYELLFISRDKGVTWLASSVGAW